MNFMSRVLQCFGEIPVRPLKIDQKNRKEDNQRTKKHGLNPSLEISIRVEMRKKNEIQKKGNILPKLCGK